MIKSIKLENGKEYRLFTSRMVIEVKTSRVHAETGWPIWMRVNGARVISQVISAIADVDHTEALDMNAAIEWAKITPEQRAIHDSRVTHGISLKNKYNTDDVLEACHAEALEINALIPAVARAVSKIDNADYQMQAMFWAANDYSARRRIIEAAHLEALEFDEALNYGLLVLCDEGNHELFDLLNDHSKCLLVNACHAEALNMEAARQLNARQARFVFHNTAVERAEAIEAAHVKALEMNYRISCTAHLHCPHMDSVNDEYIAMRNEAEAMNSGFDNSFHRAAKNWGAMDWFSREVELEKAHIEALEIDAKMKI